ncbi:MAG TPA: response regulator transcription factor [Acidimicrobiales bacterium]|nr:response regulator transcription factor [Acidimicrobiales bacterium]
MTLAAVAWSGRQIRVMVVDDQEVVCRGVAAVLANARNLVVCGTANGTAEAVAMARALLPDVVVMDVRIDEASGIEATREIRSHAPATKVIMLTAFDDDDAVFSSIMAGAAGYLLKQVRGAELIGAIQAVSEGRSILDTAVTTRVLDLVRRRGEILRDERLARLSQQEERILTLIAAGRTNKAIAQELFLAEKTVKNHISHILAKLGTVRRAEAAAYMIRHQRYGSA